MSEVAQAGGEGKGSWHVAQDRKHSMKHTSYTALAYVHETALAEQVSFGGVNSDVHRGGGNAGVHC